jgi:hypothetical protein
MAYIRTETKKSEIDEKELSDLEIAQSLREDLSKYAEYKDLSFIRGVNGFYNEAYSFETNELCKKYGQNYCMVENDFTEIFNGYEYKTYVKKSCILKAFYGKGYLDKEKYTFGDIDSYADRLYLIVLEEQKGSKPFIYVYEYDIYGDTKCVGYGNVKKHKKTLLSTWGLKNKEILNKLCRDDLFVEE